MKKILVAAGLALSLLIPVVSFADTDLKANEKAFFTEMRKAIPVDRIKTIDDLYAKWQEIENSKSEALIIDIRTEAEFNAGHIKGSSNIDSGHAYGLPKKIKDANKEIWVFCRTQHRATYFVGMLYNYGYSNVYLVEGGIKGWAEKGHSLVNKYLGEFQVKKYEKKLKEDFWYRENK